MNEKKLGKGQFLWPLNAAKSQNVLPECGRGQKQSISGSESAQQNTRSVALTRIGLLRTQAVTGLSNACRCIVMLHLNGLWLRSNVWLPSRALPHLPGVQLRPLTHRVTVPSLQFAKDDRGEECHSA